MKDAKAQFHDWENALREVTMLSLAEQLRDSVSDPLTADAEACWAHIWNKPLYANTAVAIGDKYFEALRPHMPGAWTFIGLDRQRFLISHTGRGNAVDNFDIQGDIPAKVRGKPKIAPHRLMAIQNGAGLLRELVESHGHAAPFAAFVQVPLDQLVRDLKDRLGRGWGPISILHLLTEFGLAVKPDLHLVRAVRVLGLLPDLKESDAVSGKAAVEIVAAVRELAWAIHGREPTRAELRYIDKLLMEASRQGLLAPEQRHAA